MPARLRPGRGREERLALTPAGVVTVCIAGALLLGAFLGPSNMLLLVCCLALGPLAADAYFAIATLRRCVPARRCPAIAAAGEVTLVELTLANRSRLPATQVVAADRLRNRTEDLAAPVRFSRVPPRATVTGVYRLRPMTRGRHALGPITLSTQFPLGLVRRESVRPAPGELLVLPLLGEMTAAWIRAGGTRTNSSAPPCPAGGCSRTSSTSSASTAPATGRRASTGGAAPRPAN